MRLAGNEEFPVAMILFFSYFFLFFFFVSVFLFIPFLFGRDPSSSGAQYSEHYCYVSVFRFNPFLAPVILGEYASSRQAAIFRDNLATRFFFFFFL